MKDSKGKKVDDYQVAGDCIEDLYILNAIYVDGEAVPDAELDYLTEKYSAEVYEKWFDNQVARADAYWEGER